MDREKIESFECFERGRQEEKEYLLHLKSASKASVETPELEYIQKLINLQESE
jgi:hypothetical protein